MDWVEGDSWVCWPGGKEGWSLVGMEDIFCFGDG